jgi:hypothetical protein
MEGTWKQLQANDEAMHGLPQSKETTLESSRATQLKALPLPI